MHGLGVDVEALYAKGIDFMLQQAANWARIPTRLNRAEAARAIVEQAALQRGDQQTVAVMQTTREAIRRVRTMYDNGSAKVADVVDRFRVLPPGTVPPLSLAPKAAEAAAIVASTTGALTEIERQIADSATRVLTPQQQAQLNSGLSFPTFMGNQAKQVLTYVVVGGVIYFAIRALGRVGGTRSW